ncbi:SigB/SigF/SigG family RNA polymerase sigma factor [Spirillospora sp. NPDC048832]
MAPDPIGPGIRTGDPPGSDQVADTDTASDRALGPAPDVCAGARSQPSQPRDRDDEYAVALLKQMKVMGEADPRRERLRAELVDLHTGLVNHIARRYAGRGEPLDDLRQVAYLGLVAAINRFDPDRGTRFTAYAIPLMVGEVKRHFRDTTWSIRVSRHVQEMRPRLRDAVHQFTGRHGRAPTTAEIAAALQITEEDVTETIIWSNAYRPLSLDAPAGHDGDSVGDHPFSHYCGGEDPALDLVVDGTALTRQLADLPKRERTIVLLRFYGNQSQTQIAEQIGLSQMQVSRLLSRTLQQLRTSLLADR